MKSQDVAFWKEAINDELDSIMENSTWVLANLPPGCKPLGCKWIFQRKLKMDVKTSLLNGELDEEVYMNQPPSFIMPGNENKVCKLIKSLFGLKQAPKQWHQKFDEVVLFGGYLLNQADKCVYSKFDESGKGVIICLYVDDILIFGTDQVQKIKHESNRIAISQSHYIKKVLKKFNYLDYTPVSTLMDTSEKLMPNNGQAISQLEYSRVIGCLMYAMTCIRPDIAFVIEGYTNASWINNTEKNSSISGWVFLLGGAAAGKEAEWLRNLILKILLWSKPISPISIQCDSAATLANVYSQMYNGKSRHLVVVPLILRDEYHDVTPSNTYSVQALFGGVTTPSLANKKYFVTFIDDASREVVRLLDSKLKTLGERDIECIFVGYDEHSKAFRFPSVPRLSQRSLLNGTEDIDGLVVPEEVTEEDESKTFDEAMKSQDVAFWKEAINDEMDSIMGNNTK
ncbi:zinc finger, CCHC-type containing protein, partial [Tanacetum coccineum]